MSRFLTLLGTIVLTSLMTVGCGKKKDSPSPTASPTASPEAKAEGVLFAEPGDKYHIRLIIDAKAKEAVAKLLDETAKNPVEIKEGSITLTIKDAKPVQITLATTGEKGSKTSTFKAQDDVFAGKLDMDKVEITAAIRGKTYHFKVDEHGHDH